MEQALKREIDTEKKEVTGMEEEWKTKEIERERKRDVQREKELWDLTEKRNSEYIQAHDGKGDGKGSGKENGKESGKKSVENGKKNVKENENRHRNEARGGDGKEGEDSEGPFKGGGGVGWERQWCGWWYMGNQLMVLSIVQVVEVCICLHKHMHLHLHISTHSFPFFFLSLFLPDIFLLRKTSGHCSSFVSLFRRVRRAEN